MTVTVDVGASSDVFPGALVTWLHVPRGGYGYVFPVDAVVVAHARRPRTWVRISVITADGRRVERRVEAANLMWRDPGRGGKEGA
jgi:hypothetical protein